jgi:epoxyqueuosine reductase
MPGQLNAHLVKQHALELDFDAVGVCDPVITSADAEQHLAWLARGHAGALAYLARAPQTRYDARSLLPSCRSVIATALSYHHAAGVSRANTPPRIARYAQGEDYHSVVREKLEALAGWLATQVPGVEWRATVDSSPIAEKAFAVAAGLGWRGKHSLILNRELGSYFVIGLLLVSLDLEPDAPVADGCGSCTHCLAACPAGALPEPRVLDVRRCISYLTTARKAPPGDPAILNGWFYGCDECQQACPYNERAAASREPRFAPKPEVLGLTWGSILEATGDRWQTRFRGSVLGSRELELLIGAGPNSEQG